MIQLKHLYLFSFLIYGLFRNMLFNIQIYYFINVSYWFSVYYWSALFMIFIIVSLKTSFGWTCLPERSEKWKLMNTLFSTSSKVLRVHVLSVSTSFVGGIMCNSIKWESFLHHTLLFHNCLRLILLILYRLWCKYCLRLIPCYWKQ